MDDRLKKPLLIAGGAAALLVLLWPRKGGAMSLIAPVSLASISGLAGRPLPPDRSPMTAKQVEVLLSMLNAAREVTDLTRNEALALASLAWNETRFNPSAEGTVDAKWGNSYTLFQLRKDIELKGMLEKTGLEFEDVVPPRGTSNLYPYIRNQVRVAYELMKAKGLSNVRSYASGNPELFLLDMGARWAGIRSWEWARTQPAPMSVIGGRIPVASEFPGVIDALSRAGAKGTAGLMRRLWTFRALREVV